MGLFSARGTVSKHLSISDIRFHFCVLIIVVILLIWWCLWIIALETGADEGGTKQKKVKVIGKKAELIERLKHAIYTDSVGRQVILVNASAYGMGMRAIAGVQLCTTVTKRNSNTNTSPNPNPNNPTYPTDPVTLLTNRPASLQARILPFTIGVSA